MASGQAWIASSISPTNQNKSEQSGYKIYTSHIRVLLHNIEHMGNVSAVHGWSSVTNTDATGKTSVWPLAWWKIATSIKDNTPPNTVVALFHKSTEVCSNTWQPTIWNHMVVENIHTHTQTLTHTYTNTHTDTHTYTSSANTSTR